MDKDEFEIYLFVFFVSLYPDSKDVPGKRVCIKLDSGPGQINAELMAQLKLLGFYVFPGIPNTISVTQETDRICGPFTTKFCSNLSECCYDRLFCGKLLSFAPWIFGLFVFGGCDPETGVDKYVDAFAGAFSKAQCIAAWEAVGAVPPTCACLNDKQVCREVGDSSPNDDIQIEMTEMQRANTMACDLLTACGFQGHFLKAELKKKPEVNESLVTVPNSKERVEALAKASTHGAIFAVTGGEHFTSDDMFKAAEMPQGRQGLQC